MSTSLSLQAYCKLILHAAKYPHAAVNGLLLAKAPKEKAKEEGEDDVATASVDAKTPLHITDAIPLFHQALGLAPMLEIALNEVEAFCTNHGLVIAGYYQANEHYDSSVPDNVAYRIADKINSYFSRSVLLMIDNKKVSPIAESLAYRLFVSVGDQEWREQKTSSNADEQTMLFTTSNLLENKVARDLIDFDNHLDDFRSDWRNLELNRVISDMTV